MGLLWGPTDARVCERYYRSTVGNESSEGLSLFASKPHAPTLKPPFAASEQSSLPETGKGSIHLQTTTSADSPGRDALQQQTTKKNPNPTSFFDGQGGQPFALGLKALGPLGL